jgi:ArsR family transcriptional regulator
VDRASALYRLLGDAARLRILRVLSAERLNVTELTGVLGMAQSGVSRHLGLLKDAGLVQEERAGGFSYYRAAPPAEGNGNRPGALAPLWLALRAQFDESGSDPDVRADQARLEEVLRLRQENFDSHGDESRQLVPGRSWAAWARALGHLLPPVRVADLGCGEGYLTVETARWAGSVVAIDHSDEALRRARALVRRRRLTNVEFKRGEIEQLPLADSSVDIALLSQALHHAGDPARALAEAVRITVPGGRVLVLDLRPHDQAWVRERLGDRWLGFDEARLSRLMTDAGLEHIRTSAGTRKSRDPFSVVIASGTKPLDPPHQPRWRKQRRPQ